jgi:hypothetical protein
MKRIWSALAVSALTACASAPGAGSAGGSRMGNVITEQDIEKIEVNDAAQIVERLRPNWLRGRGAASISGGTDLPVVYLDDSRQGGPEQLGRISARIIREIRFVPGTEAAVRWGLGHGGGVIQVVTKRPG